MPRKITPPSPTPTPAEDESYPSCETTLWQLGQWRCDYWRPAGTWCASSLKLFRGPRLVKAVGFGLDAWKQSKAWREAVRAQPDADPR